MESLDKVYAKKIAEEYAPKKSRKVLQLKKLDNKVKLPANIFGILFGIVGVLTAGAGMSMTLTTFGPEGTLGLVLGVSLGVVGAIFCAINYPIYKAILNARKNKYAYEITELAKEITENEE